MKQCIGCGLENEEHLTTCPECGEDLVVILEEIPQKNSKSTPPEASIISHKKQDVVVSSFLLLLGTILIHAGLFSIVFKVAYGKGINLTDIVITIILIFIGVFLCKKGITYSLRWNFIFGTFFIILSLPVFVNVMVFFNNPGTENGWKLLIMYGSVGLIVGLIFIFKNKLS